VIFKFEIKYIKIAQNPGWNMKKIYRNSPKHSRPSKKIIWFTGLSGSGKTTLSLKLSRYLRSLNFSSIYLDGDDIRAGLSNDLSFTDASREENIRRVAELAKLLIEQTDFVIVSTISPSNPLRNLAKEIVGKKLFSLVYLSTPIGECMKRDPKGHYKNANLGIIKNFTGISSKYEVPLKPDLEIDTSILNQRTSLLKLKTWLKLV
jgi:adenylylsulfate kinase